MLRSNNKKFSGFYSVVLSVSFAAMSFVGVAVADDDDHKGKKDEQVEPIELLINFRISGSPNSSGAYVIGGPGYAPDDINKENGEISDELKEDRNVATLSDAEITFDGGDPYAPIVNFTCNPGTCTIAFKDGSELTSATEGQVYSAGPYAGLSPYVKLEGKAINKWGPIVRSPDFDYVNGIFPTRILGCGGLIGTAGRFKGMVGSICFNGNDFLSRELI